ncbi:MAG: hypothetical protein ACTSUZ_10325 [Candidatus Thorarchaeota archaeon]
MTGRMMKAAIVLVVVMGGLGVYMMYIQPNLSYGVEQHLSASVPDQLDVYSIILSGLEDTNLTITYRNDSSLLYQIDFTLYEPATFGQALSVDTSSERWLLLDENRRIQLMSVILGSGLPYSLSIWGDTPLNTTMIFDNGAVFDDVEGIGDEVSYYATGILNIAITENVSINHWIKFNLDSGVATPDDVLLNIDLPVGVDGYLRLGTTPASFTTLDGWYFRGDGKYSTTTELNAVPSVNFYLQNSLHVYASLRN